VSAADGRLAENIVYFARALRAAGIPVGPGAVLDALAAVRTAGVGTREDFYWTLHSVFVNRHEHTVLFDQAFRIFFKRRGYLEQLLGMTLPQVPGSEPDKPKAGSQRVQEALFSGLNEQLKQEVRELDIDMRLTVSDQELLQKKDFAQMSAAEIASAKAAIRHRGSKPNNPALLLTSNDPEESARMVSRHRCTSTVHLKSIGSCSDSSRSVNIRSASPSSCRNLASWFFQPLSRRSVFPRITASHAG